MPKKTESEARWTLRRAHEWTHTGDEVLIVKCVNRSGSLDNPAANGFIWPLTVGAVVSAPDWDPKPVCGHGLHGWPWGLSIGDGKNPDYAGTWLVFGAKPTDVVDLNGKVKARAGVIRFVGSWDKAFEFVLTGQMELVYRSARGAASATGASGAASATGESGAASATGAALSAVVTGLGGKAKAGLYGCIALAWWNVKSERVEMRCSCIGGRHGLKADTWYCLDENGKFVEDAQS